MSDVRSALAAFIARYLRRYPTLRTRHDPRWPSPCTTGVVDAHGEITWQPTPRAWGVAEAVDLAPHANAHRAGSSDIMQRHDFAPLERALEVSIHQDICCYFSAYWSGSLEATAAFGAVSLLLLWNEQDVARLIENQIGHVLAQRRARAPLTIFFACGAPDTDHIYSVDNASAGSFSNNRGANRCAKSRLICLHFCTH